MERPSCSTSGGQSDGIEREGDALAVGVVVWTALGLFSFEPGAERAMAIHEDTEVQDRHLRYGVSIWFEYPIMRSRHTVCHQALTRRL